LAIFGPCVGQVVPAVEDCEPALLDEDCDGTANEEGASCMCAPGAVQSCYDGPPGTAGVGICSEGVAECAEDGSGFGPCVGQVMPSVEDCEPTLLDEDCDGITNEEGARCGCAPGAVESCYDGPPGTAGIGVCKTGEHTCETSGLGYGPCSGQVLPAAELCFDATDENCDGIVNGGCVYASCAELATYQPGLPSGTYDIDPDGTGSSPPVSTYCEMELDGGGWTLVLVASDDGQNTWTYDERARMTTDTTPIGSSAELSKDFKSPAYHVLPFTDLLFAHSSGQWAAYGGVGNGMTDIGTFMAGIAYPVCSLALAGNGYPMTAGTIGGGQLCDTDLYFHLGDMDFNLSQPSSEAYCQGNQGDDTYGPAWSWANNHGCPFDDPGQASLGPIVQCSGCPAGTSAMEFSYLGFAGAMALNAGMSGTGQNNMRMYVR
jgi:hypothetical protein